MNQLYYFILGLRPKQWIKNFIIFIPLIFSGNLFNLEYVFITIFVFFIFSLVSGSTYIINDYIDIDSDKNHKTKKYRPLASGKLNKTFALFSSFVLLLLSLIIASIFFNKIIFILFLTYLLNTIIYSIYIKNIVIVDVFSIAIGFVIRGLIGIFAIGVILSEWFLVIVFFGALLLGFLKRFQEIKLKSNSRKNIKDYNEEFLKQIIGMIVSILLFIYTLYTFNSSQSSLLVITLPIVVFGIIRYYYNIFFLEKYSEGIEYIILKDKLILGSVLVYMILIYIIIYFK